MRVVAGYTFPQVPPIQPSSSTRLCAAILRRAGQPPRALSVCRCCDAAASVAGRQHYYLCKTTAYLFARAGRRSATHLFLPARARGVLAFLRAVRLGRRRLQVTCLGGTRLLYFLLKHLLFVACYTCVCKLTLVYFI